MQAVRQILKTQNGKITIDIPEYLGKEVEVIILPMGEKDRDSSYFLMKYQEQTNFAKEVLGSEKEDVWNEV
jgi:hypothetical protein